MYFSCGGKSSLGACAERGGTRCGGRAGGVLLRRQLSRELFGDKQPPSASALL